MRDDLAIRRLDGGLLLVFRELLRRRRAKEVATRLGLSQPAVSHALGRLRDLFGDPLFIRRPHGLEPTTRALELGPRIEALIDLAGATLSREGLFDPKRCERQFNMGGSGGSALDLLAPPLFASLRKRAPRATIRFREQLHWSAMDALRRGELDIAVGLFGRVPSGLRAEALYEDDYCIVARRGHPRIKGAIDEAAYAGIGHVFVSPPTPDARHAAPDHGEVSSIYGTIPDPREIVTLGHVPRFTMALDIVASSDAIADCPRRLAEQHAPLLGLQILDLPFKWPGFTVKAVRREETDDAGVDWLWTQVHEAARRPARPRARKAASGAARRKKR